MQAGEVEAGDGFGAAIGRAEILHRVGPEAAEARSEQHNRARWNPPMTGLPLIEIASGHLIVGIGCGLAGHIDEHRGADQILEGDLIDGSSALSEMNGRIDVRAAVLRGREVVRGIEVAIVGQTLGDLLQPEGLGGRPEQRVLVVAVRQIHHRTRRECGW